MTELIDLNFIKMKEETLKVQDLQGKQQDMQKFKMNQINRTIEKIIHQIDKNYIKRLEIYFFHFHLSKIKEQQSYWNHQLKLYASISIKHKIFTFKLYLLDSHGSKIQSKSIHHRTFLSNFVLQINAQLQNFKVQYNPQSGEFNFVFNLSCQYIDETSVTDVIDYAFQSYFEQSEAYFYILNLIEMINLPQNQFMLNIEEDCRLLKRWLRQRRIQNHKLREQFNRINQISSFHLKVENSSSKSVNLIENDIQQYLIQQSQKLRVQREPNLNKLKQTYKKFKEFYKEQDIFTKHLTNKTKFKNYLQIETINLSNLNDLFQSIAYNQHSKHQNKDKNTQIQYKSLSTQKIRIWDKNSGKNYFLQFLNLGKELAKKEEIILQKLSKFESFLFFNQYVAISKIDLSQIGYVAINASSNQILLSNFLKNNDHTTSLAVRFELCINLVQIFLTLNMKSKITNYFPIISTENIVLNKRLSLSIKHLSKISICPLFELINTLSRILFQKPFSIKQNHLSKQLVCKGDEIKNKFLGISIHINIIKYYFLELYYESICLMKLQDLKSSNKSTKLQENQRYDYWTKQTLLRCCQQLLVIFNHCKNALSRGYEQDSNYFNLDISDED